MGLFANQFDFARHRAFAHCRTYIANPRRTWGKISRIFGTCLSLLLAAPAAADSLRIATYNIDFSDKGPGLVLQSLAKGGTAQQLAVVATIADLQADVLLLTGIDYDAEGHTLAALAGTLAGAGAPYPYHFALRPNSGLATGFDLNGNGRLGEPRDAMAYGRYAGEGGMALLSRLPIDTTRIRDFSAFLWADLPQSLSPDTDPALRGVQRLSSGGHYEVPVTLPDGKSLRLLAFYASPPAFDGDDDRNGKRNHDEAAFWLSLIAGHLPFAPPAVPFAIIGQASLDPMDGDGRAGALRTLLAHPALTDPAPRGTSGRVDSGHLGDAALDTTLYQGLGGLRVQYILPSRDIAVQGAGIVWPPESDPKAQVLATASRHRPVWVDISLP